MKSKKQKIQKHYGLECVLHGWIMKKHLNRLFVILTTVSDIVEYSLKPCCVIKLMQYDNDSVGSLMSLYITCVERWVIKKKTK